jgi:hypothetical protein
MGPNKHNFFFEECAKYARYAMPFIKNIDRMLSSEWNDVVENPD